MMRRLLTAVLALAAGAPAWAETAPAAIPFKHDAASSASAWPGSALPVVIISLAAIAAVYAVRKHLNMRKGKDGDARLLRVLETQRLGPRALLSVVEFDGRRYLVAQSEHGVNCLASSPAAVSPAGAEQA